jgi:hypothetical protein
MVSAALILWYAFVVAGVPDYDAFSEPDGFITEKQELAAWKMMRDPDQFESVYADAAKGNVRAARVVRQLEATLSASGRGLAERVSRPECLAPVVELAPSCRPDWSFLDFLSKERPAGVQFRIAIFIAFEARARELGLENQVTLSVINGLLSVALARAVLAQAKVVGSSETILNVTRLRETELATGKRLSRKLGVPLAESPHLGADFVDAAGKTYDALGTPAASQRWNQKDFIKAIDDHLLKSNDFTVIDLTGFTPAQIQIVQRHLSTLKPDQLAKLIRIGF